MYSFDVKNQIQSLASCDICHIKNITALKKVQNNERITEIDIENDCSSCCDWNFESPNAHFIVPNVDYKAIDFFIKNGYDVVDENGSYLHSKCIKLDFRKLKDIVIHVSLEYFKNRISQGTFICILERCQINGDHASFVHAQCVQLQTVIDFDTKFITADWLEKQFTFPTLWDGVFSSEAYHECPMHLLFLNVYKNFQQQMTGFYKANSSLTKFG